MIEADEPRAGRPDARVERWLHGLDERHLSDLTPSEVTRGLRALSSCYVERREKLSTGAALDGAGKRAAFALFYGPQHYLIARGVVGRLVPQGDLQPDGGNGTKRVVDLGCGTGSAGAAAALATSARRIEGFDLNPWAVREANWTYRAFDLQGRASMTNVSRARLHPSPGTLILAAYSVNELSDVVRSELLRRFQDAHRKGASVLVIEPIGRRVNLWWNGWADAFATSGVREPLARLDGHVYPPHPTHAHPSVLTGPRRTPRSL